MMVMFCTDTDWLFSEEAFSIYAACMYQPTYEAYKVRMARFLSDPAVQVFVCEASRKKAGMLVLDRSASIAEIVGIAVAQTRRRHGIGRALIREAMRLAELDGIRAQTDEDAIGFYRKCGFAEERTVKTYTDGVAVRYDCYYSKHGAPDLTR